MEEGSLFQRMKHLLKGEDELNEGAQKEAAGLIHNIIRYLDKDAKDIMTHRKHIVTIDGDELLEDGLKFMLEENFSRFPSIPIHFLWRIEEPGFAGQGYKE